LVNVYYENDLTFETIAKSLTSPNEYCTLLLQSALKRKAGETSSNYEEFQSHFESILGDSPLFISGGMWLFLFVLPRT
jgi:hypothetical protein